ncbi:MAG: dTMP kinase [Francisellaceae bacterium]|jgi:dTMP kinase
MPLCSKLIVIEGLEGAGKSTVINALKNHFSLNFETNEYIFTREPGGTPLAERIRDIIISSDQNEKLCDESELLLMYASRMQHVKHLIEPALLTQKWVISDRFYLSTFAYQGGGRSINNELLHKIHNMLLQNFKPGLTIYLDIEPKLGLERIQSRDVIDRIESEQIDFFQRTRKAYLHNIKQENNYYIIDASKTAEEVKKEVVEKVKHYHNSCT